MLFYPVGWSIGIMNAAKIKMMAKNGAIFKHLVYQPKPEI